MSRTQRRELIRILIGLAVFAAGWCVPADLLSGWGARAVFAAAYALAGWDVLWASLRNILRGEVFDENFLMAVASIGAMALGDFAEGAAVMHFDPVGEWFPAYAVGRPRGSLAALQDLRPDFANVLRGGQTLRGAPDEVQVGETILVRPGGPPRGPGRGGGVCFPGLGWVPGGAPLRGGGGGGYRPRRRRARAS